MPSEVWDLSPTWPEPLSSLTCSVSMASYLVSVLLFLSPYGCGPQTWMQIGLSMGRIKVGPCPNQRFWFDCLGRALGIQNCKNITGKLNGQPGWAQLSKACSPHCRQNDPFTGLCVNSHPASTQFLLWLLFLLQKKPSVTEAARPTWLGTCCLSKFILYNLSYLTARHPYWSCQYPLRIPISRLCTFCSLHLEHSSPVAIWRAPQLHPCFVHRSLLKQHLTGEAFSSSLSKIAAPISLHCITLLYFLCKFLIQQIHNHFMNLPFIICFTLMKM